MAALNFLMRALVALAVVCALGAIVLLLAVRTGAAP